jgi:DnaK suppressor protein
MPQRIIKKIQEIGNKFPKKIVKPKKTKPKKVLVAKEYLPIKKILQKKERQLKKQLANVANKRKSVKGDYKARFPFFGHGKDEDAQEVTHYEKQISIEHQLEGELEKVNIALKKIEENKYGVCKVCKKKIKPERLKIYPEAEHCMECHKKGI